MVCSIPTVAVRAVDKVCKLLLPTLPPGHTGYAMHLESFAGSLWLLTTAELHVNSEHNPTLAQRQSFSVPAEPHTLAIMTTLANTANGLLC